MALNSDETIDTLNEFWETEISFWERRLGVDSDESKEPYIKVLQEMGNMQLEYSPFLPFPNEDSKLDPDGVKDFFRYKKMDAYGKDWKNKETGGAIWT